MAVVMVDLSSLIHHNENETLNFLESFSCSIEKDSRKFFA